MGFKLPDLIKRIETNTQPLTVLKLTALKQLAALFGTPVVIDMAEVKNKKKEGERKMKNTNNSIKGLLVSDYTGKGILMSDFSGKGILMSDYTGKGILMSDYTGKGILMSD